VPVVDNARCGFLWGDARPANMVLDDDLTVVGLLDWELAAAGPGELDIAWFLEMNHMRSTGQGIAPLAGFPDAAGTWTRWERSAGRRADHTEWYGMFSAYRVAVFMQLYLAAMIHRGRLPTGHKLLRDNPGTRRLDELLRSD
jgi:aminoglycoside phosphotransferase (APT) family kinase protein